MAKVNYQYEKRQKELQKKRKKDEKEKLKQIRKNAQPQEAEVTPETQADKNTPPVPPAES